MPTSRLEVDVRRLLSKCEEMAKQDDLAQNWRLPKVIKLYYTGIVIKLIDLNCL